MLAEALCRLAFRLYYGTPFRDRRIAEYPYADFVELADPPLHYVYTKGFRSPRVNINRFGLRGEEPAPDGVKRRILVVGESTFFGAKLRDVRRIWSKQLEQRLIREGHGDWEVLNGGSTVYNSSQHWHFWAKELERVKLKILVLSFCESIDRDAYYFFDLLDTLAHDLCPELGVPYLDLKGDFDAYPPRFECWYDLLHWNEKGMDFIADALYRRIHHLGWWD